MYFLCDQSQTIFFYKVTELSYYGDLSQNRKKKKKEFLTKVYCPFFQFGS